MTCFLHPVGGSKIIISTRADSFYHPLQPKWSLLSLHVLYMHICCDKSSPTSPKEGRHKQKTIVYFRGEKKEQEFKQSMPGDE